MAITPDDTRITAPMLQGPSILPQGADPVAAVVFLHGYGADGNDLISLAHELAPHLAQPVAFFSPHAPYATAFGMGRQWFSDAGGTFEDRPGIEAAKDELEDFLEERIYKPYGIRPEKTVLLGFSMGAMTALHAAPRLKEKVAGVISCSGCLMYGAELENTPGLHRMPVLLTHGREDEVLPYDNTEHAGMVLRHSGFEVDTHLLDQLDHGIDMRVIALIRDFLARILS